MRPFRFGVMGWKAPDRSGWQAFARSVESLGYSTLVIGDHMWDQFAPVPALLSAAEATTTLRVGTMVFGNDYRHPVLLAKETATLDVLSEGRLEVGLGAGWLRADYTSAGLALDPAGERIDRMEEAVAVLKGLWCSGGAPFSLSGAHYEVSSLAGTPAPVQSPHPPLLIGGGGPRMLAVAARHADIVGITPSLRSGVFGERDASIETTRERVEVVREAAGERFGDVELSMMTYVLSGEDDLVFLEPKLRRFGIDVSQRLTSPHVWIGSADDVAARLVSLREELGVSYWVVQQELFEKAAPVVAMLAGK